MFEDLPKVGPAAENILKDVVHPKIVWIIRRVPFILYIIYGRIVYSKPATSKV